MHLIESNIEKFTSKEDSALSSEIMSLPKLISKEQLAERQEVFSKSAEERKALKKAKRNVNKELATRNVVNFANNNKIASSDFRIIFTKSIHK